MNSIGHDVSVGMGDAIAVAVLVGVLVGPNGVEVGPPGVCVGAVVEVLIGVLVGTGVAV